MKYGNMSDSLTNMIQQVLTPFNSYTKRLYLSFNNSII